MIEIKSYLKLSKDELFEILRLRTNIFVVEQNCPYPELDDYDKISHHLLAQKENKMVGTLRIIEFENEVKIGRVAIHQEFRKLGLGKKIMLVGLMNKFEIWDESRWHEQMLQDTELERLGDFEPNQDLDNFTL